MVINKVVYNNEVLVDVTDCDIVETDVVRGKKFIKKNGEKAVGTANNVIQDLIDCRGGTTELFCDDQYYDWDNWEIPEGYNENIHFAIDKIFEATDLSYLFYNCYSLTEIPLFEMSDNVTNMESMFDCCESLVKVPPLKTSHVTNMNSMFNDCSSLTEIPSIDMSSATDLSNMFRDCSSLTSIDKFLYQIPKIGDYMFSNCG